MSENEPPLAALQKQWHGTLKAYGIGLLGSLLLTFVAFFVATLKLFAGPVLMWTLGLLAFAQAIVQLLFFLHLGQESEPRWETLIFSFMVLVLAIIVIGSLWIMYDLNCRVMMMGM